MAYDMPESSAAVLQPPGVDRSERQRYTCCCHHVESASSPRSCPVLESYSSTCMGHGRLGPPHRSVKPYESLDPACPARQRQRFAIVTSMTHLGRSIAKHGLEAVFAPNVRQRRRDSAGPWYVHPELL
jgi:hypothetical protein